MVLKMTNNDPRTEDIFFESMAELFGDNEEIDQTALVAIAKK